MSTRVPSTPASFSLSSSSPSFAPDGTEQELPGELDARSRQIEALLDALERSVDPHIWDRIEELVREVVTLYGAGLERLLRLGRRHARRAADLETDLLGDRLLGGLLSLHDLHVMPLSARLDAALDGMHGRTALEGITLEGVTGDGGRTVVLRPAGLEARPPPEQAHLAALVQRAVELAAPEIEHVRVEVPGSTRPGWDRLGSTGSGRGTSAVDRLAQIGERPRGPG